ncbi:DUF4430 domain-containing protein [Bacillus carboniphilus]|uniref:DUF4430 domain-containing protein n=1 Tax=Bacillus carboniphilus TaxID=86663 RepID=A0ABY9JTN3_9BACI|nr:DUF4430 domain-containing protein [Bacillus carboniphilus]WLR42717.1 DUF4430 domain-containing protein [Bacillus carboniphilus]
MKSTIKLLTILSLSFLLTACFSTTQVETEKNEPKTEEISHEEEIKDEKQIEKETKNESESDSTNEEKPQSEQKSKIETHSQNEVEKKSDSSTTTRAPNEEKSKSNTKASESEKQKETESTKATSSPSAKSEKTEGKTKKPVEEKQTNTAYTKIVGHSDIGTILSKTEITIEDGDTAFNILVAATKKQNMQLEYSGSGSTVYIKGINNLYEFDYGPYSGWKYRVNGTFPNKSAGAVTLQKGDYVEWFYTEDLGKDIGGGS